MKKLPIVILSCISHFLSPITTRYYNPKAIEKFNQWLKLSLLGLILPLGTGERRVFHTFCLMTGRFKRHAAIRLIVLVFALIFTFSILLSSTALATESGGTVEPAPEETSTEATGAEATAPAPDGTVEPEPEPVSEEPITVATTEEAAIDTGDWVSMPTLASDPNTGAATSSIGIKAPPGTGGMEPGVSLSYASNGGNGHLGMGWSMGSLALSKITRCKANRGQHGYHGTINFNANDRLCMNGQQLVAVSGLYGADGTEYRIDRDPFTKIISYGYSGSGEGPGGGPTGPESFTVWLKNGMTITYGGTSDSRIEAAGSSNVLTWAANKVMDTNGNYMVTSYIEEPGTSTFSEFYPDRILYTANDAGGFSAQRGVEFFYETRPDITEKYVGGSITSLTKRMTSIKTKVDGNLYRDYQLVYDQGTATKRSRLVSVTECDGNANCLQPTVLTYSDGINKFDPQGVWATYEGSGFSYLDPRRVSYADFNGDGMDDMIYQAPVYTGVFPLLVYDHDDYNVYLSDGTTFLPKQTWFSHDMGSETIVSGRVSYADINGDGMTDMILQSGGSFYVYISTGNGFSPKGVALAVNSNYIQSALQDQYVDIDGDGAAELVFEYNSDVQTYNYNETTNTFDFIAASGIDIWWESIKFYPGWVSYADVNGDSMADLIHRDASNDFTIYLSDGAVFHQTPDELNLPNIHSVGFVKYADMNGDGLADMIFQHEWNQFEVFLSDGFKFQPDGIWFDHIYGTVTPTQVQFVDVNGDGMADMIFHGYPNDIEVYLSTGTGFRNMVKWAEIGGIQNEEYNNANYADVDGDGKADMIFAGGQLAPNFEVFLSDGYFPDLLRKIDNPIGGSMGVEYTPSSQYSNTNLPFIVQTVSAVAIDDGLGNIIVSNTEYSGGLMNYNFRDFRGFAYVKTTDPVGTTNETWFHQDVVYKNLPSLRQTKDSLDPSGNRYDKVTSLYNATMPFPGVIFTYLEQEDAYLYDDTTTARQTSATFEYDTYGNITHRHFDGDLSVVGDEKDEYTEYTNDTVNWILGLPDHTYVNDYLGTKVVEGWMTYDPNTGNLWTEKAWNNVGPDPEITYAYDAFGNRDKITDALNNDLTISYDSTYHTFPDVTTNAKLHTITTTYDPASGKLLSSTGPNGHTITNYYDGFGRITKVTGPLDTGSTYGTAAYSYSDFGTPGSQRVVANITEEHGTSDYIWSEKYFDGLGREIISKMEGLDSKVIRQDSTYDNRGLLFTKTLPYFYGESSLLKTFEYDPVGRLVKSTNPDATFSTVAYDRGLVISTDPNGNRRDSYTDVYGRLAWVKEYKDDLLYATTDYEYNTVGNLTKVTDTHGNETIIGYDSLGNKVSMDDPDMGVWGYTYDLNGNLKIQTDALGQVIIFDYDSLARLTLKDYSSPSETDIVYTYDDLTHSNAIGRLTNITDASGQSNVDYDALGQIVKTEKIVDTVSYVVETVYDAIGRPKSIKYPDNEVVSYLYDTGGNLIEITGYAAYTNFDAFGRPGTVTFNNNVTTQYVYRADNELLDSTTTTDPLAVDIIDLFYSYDNVGNITGINDAITPDNSQSFLYDDLNRLEQATSTAYGTRDYVYDEIGNMTSKAGVTFTYPAPGSARPHGVTSISTGKSYIYDANGNMTNNGSKVITYNDDNMPSSVDVGGSVVSFVYDDAGERVKKSTATETVVYIGGLYECTGTECVKHIFAGSKRVAQKDLADTFYFHSDHLGSTSIVTDSSAVTVQETHYYPYGETRVQTGSVGIDYKFTGQELDTETALYYYGARYYDPEIGRFISPDSIVSSPGAPQTLNRYTYAGNNPVMYTDPTGHFSLWSGVIGAVAGGIHAAITGGDIWEGAAIGFIAGATFDFVSGKIINSISGAPVEGFIGPQLPTTGQSIIAGAGGGAASGGAVAAYQGEDIGRGMLLGGFSGGISAGVGLHDFENIGQEYLAQAGIGGLTGGTVSVLSGGSFTDGFVAGVRTGSTAFVSNRLAAGAVDVYENLARERRVWSVLAQEIESGNATPFIDENGIFKVEINEDIFISLNVAAGEYSNKELAFIESLSLRGGMQGTHLRGGRIHAEMTGADTYIVHFDQYPVGIRHGVDLYNGVVNTLR